MLHFFFTSLSNFATTCINISTKKNATDWKLPRGREVGTGSARTGESHDYDQVIKLGIIIKTIDATELLEQAQIFETIT